MLALRDDAANGGLLPGGGREWAQGSAGECYETALVRLKYAENAALAGDGEEAKAALLSAGKAFEAAESAWYDQSRGKDETYYRLRIEKYRAYLLYHPQYVDNWGQAIVPALDALGMTTEGFFDAPYMDRVSPETRQAVEGSIAAYWDFYIPEKSRITIYVDGLLLQMDTQPQVKNERTMTPGQATAWVDGEPVEMDVAPYADQNRTYFPVRYAAQFFGQTVTWDPAQRRVDVTQDRGPWADTDWEAWLKPMGALLGTLERGEPARFGLYARPPHTVVERDETGAPREHFLAPAAWCRELLADSWEVGDREALTAAVKELLETGSDPEFQAAAKEVRYLSDAEIARRAKRLGGTDEYMWPRTKELWDKWGKTGIRAWDLCRVAALCQWGYTAGYLTYDEAMTLAQPAAEELAAAFDSWDGVYENMIEGYYWCAREDLGGKTAWETELGGVYQYLKSAPDTRSLFYDDLFKTGTAPAAGNQ